MRHSTEFPRLIAHEISSVTVLLDVRILRKLKNLECQLFVFVCDFLSVRVHFYNLQDQKKIFFFQNSLV